MDILGILPPTNETEYNSTEPLPPAPHIPNSFLIRGIILAIMAMASLLGNSWTIWNIKKTRVGTKLSRQNCTAIYTLITHLSVADILVSSFCMIGNSVWYLMVQFLAGNIMCKLLKFSQMFSLYLSTFIIVLIGLDRLMAVKFPLRIINMGQRVRVSLLVVYILSAVLSFPQMLIFRVLQGPFSEPFIQCVDQGFYTADWQQKLYTTLTFVVMFVIPLVIMVWCYLLTFRTISNSENHMSPSQENGKGNASNSEHVRMLMRSSQARSMLLQRAKFKSLKLSVLMIMAFILCWTPYYVQMFSNVFTDSNDENENEEQESIFELVVFFFGMSNSLINPLIYGWFHLMPRRKKFYSNFQSSQTGGRTGMGVGQVSQNLIDSNRLIVRIGK